jgi:hypothetical protein
MQATGKRLYVWALTPCHTYVIRDILILFLLGQGIIRIIDGRLFTLPVLSLFPDDVFGHMQFLTGIALLLTRKRRQEPIGSTVAAIAAGVFAMLVYATWQVAVTSSWGALVLMLLSVNEALAGNLKATVNYGP